MSDSVEAPLFVITTVFVPPHVSSAIELTNPGGVRRGVVISEALSEAVRHASLSEQP